MSISLQKVAQDAHDKGLRRHAAAQLVPGMNLNEAGSLEALDDIEKAKGNPKAGNFALANPLASNTAALLAGGIGGGVLGNVTGPEEDRGLRTGIGAGAGSLGALLALSMYRKSKADDLLADEGNFKQYSAKNKGTAKKILDELVDTDRSYPKLRAAGYGAAETGRLQKLRAIASGNPDIVDSTGNIATEAAAIPASLVPFGGQAVRLGGHTLANLVEQSRARGAVGRA